MHTCNLLITTQAVASAFWLIHDLQSILYTHASFGCMMLIILSLYICISIFFYSNINQYYVLLSWSEALQTSQLTQTKNTLKKSGQNNTKKKKKHKQKERQKAKDKLPSSKNFIHLYLPFLFYLFSSFHFQNEKHFTCSMCCGCLISKACTEVKLFRISCCCGSVHLWSSK